MLSPLPEWEQMKTRVVEAIRGQFPFIGKIHRLELVDVTIQDSSDKASDPFHIDNIEAQYKSKVGGGTWAVPIRASLLLVDVASGKTIDRATITLGKLPKITRRYSYIIDGHERQHDFLFRSKSRPYHVKADNGEITAKWNLAKGMGFDIDIDRSTGRFQLALGTSHIPLYSILSSLGVTEVEMEKAWGPKVLEANRIRTKPEDLLKVHKILVGRGDKHYKPPPVNELPEFVKKTFETTQVRPDAMLAAFGKADSSVNGQNLLMSATRLLNISKGTEEEDDRQALSAKDIANTSDFIAEDITKKTLELKKKIQNNLDHKDKISDILGANSYAKIIRGSFADAQMPDQTNPLQFVSGYLRSTIRSETHGGVKGEQVNLQKDQLINPTHIGFLDPVMTPEGGEVGITLNLPLGASKVGPDLKVLVWDIRSGSQVKKSPGELERAVVAYPDQVTWPKGRMSAPKPVANEVVVYDKDRRTTKRPWKDVQYVFLSSKGLFSFAANLIPFLQNNSGNRVQFATMQQQQALSLLHREAPLVQAKSDGAHTFDQILGAFNSHISPVDGVVKDVTKGMIVIEAPGKKVAKVQVYDHFPLNGGRNMLHAESVVKVGDRVKKGQLLADTNYTKGGTLALGTNIRIAFLPFHGLNYEDGIVASESAAKRMTSIHLHQESAFLWPGMILSKKRWSDYALPEKATPERMAKLDDEGIVKVGQKVNHGDVLVAVLAPHRKMEGDEDLSRIHKSLVKDLKDASVTWDHDCSGEVAKVARAGNKIIVHVRTNEPLAQGDKLAGRYGNKGIISRILPDHEMPHDKSGKHVELLLNPVGVIGRMNVGQVYETATSKIARKTGQPYVIENFTPGVDYAQKVKDDLKKHGLSDTEELFDPKTKMSLGQVMTGEQYMLKLHHVVDKKMTARSYGGGYSTHGMAPSGAGIPGGGQKMDQLTTYAMLAHGASHNLREAYTFKADSDQSDVWLAVQTGNPLPTPKPARVVRNFLDYMRAMGIHTEKKGNEYLMAPLTDKQTSAMSNGLLKFPDKALKAKGILTKEEVGGLFDRKTTGGLDGKYWTHIQLQQRVPNPLFEGAISTLLDIKEKEFTELTGPTGIKNGKSGFDSINDRLRTLDVAKELAKCEAELPKLKGSELSKTYKKVRYLRNLQILKVSPLEAYTNQVLPVAPPSIRKVSIGMDGKQIFDDLNGLYLAVGQINQQLAKADKATPLSEMQKRQSALYEAVKSLRMTGMDMGEIGKKRHHFGLMEKLKGTEPKSSFFHDQVMGRRQDLSARSTIVPRPELGLDQLGMPEPVAMEIFKPFIVKELHTNRGYTPLEAQKLVRDGSPIVREVLHKVIEERPVIMKRDPVLHKFGVMAFHPKIIPGKAIGMHPLVCGGFNADFDGDAMAVYTPVSTEAVEEAKKMLPSQNLFSPTHGRLMPMPAQDGLLGIFQLSLWERAASLPSGVSTPAQVIKLMQDGKIAPSAVISVGGKKTTPGRLALNEGLPAALRGDPKLLYDEKLRLDKSTLQKYLDATARKVSPQEFSHVADAWKDLGNKFSYMNGSSFGVHDFHDGHTFRDAVFRPYVAKEKIILASKAPQAEKDKAIVDLWIKAGVELKSRGQARYALGTNRVHEWDKAGATKGWNQFGQLVFGPVLMNDARGKPVPIPIMKSWGEGLSLSEYWTTMHGARKGGIDRAINTSDPGSLTKDIINTVINIQVTADDCGTDKGALLPITESDVVGRYLAQPVDLKGKVISTKTLLTPAVVADMKAHGVQKVVVRSPLHCKQPKGICAMCFGHQQDGRLHAIGTNVGIISGHSLGEPVTQLVMRTFHSGGNVGGGGGVVDSFKRAKQLFHLPQTLPGSVPLCETDGKVQKISKNVTLGGTDVIIEDRRHYIPADQTILPTITVGHIVKKGDPLAVGSINPHELLAATKDIKQVRAYLTDELQKAYGDTTKRRNIETVVKGLTNLTSIQQSPGTKKYTRGQVVPLSEVEHHNRTARQLGQPMVEHTPILKPMTEVPLLVQEDWMSRLNYRNLERTYIEGAAQGWKSDIHGSIIPGLVHGAEFGLQDPHQVHTPSALHSLRKTA